jgi:hypothetical protein
MRPVLSCLLCGWFILGSWCRPASGDGGSVCLSATKGGYRITVFAAPSPLRAGPVDISVLVQDGESGEPLPQARVRVRMTRVDQPALEYPATQEAATNKLLHAAQFEIPSPGRWELEVRVEGLRGVAVVDCALEAADCLPRWLDMWPWICWPALVIALFGIHQFLARREVG